MSKFRVGMRVRLIGPWESPGPDPRGLGGVITGPGEVGPHTGYLYDWTVEISGFEPVYADSEELQPIEDEKPADYSYTELMDRLKAGEGVPA